MLYVRVSHHYHYFLRFFPLISDSCAFNFFFAFNYLLKFKIALHTENIESLQLKTDFEFTKKRVATKYALHTNLKHEHWLSYMDEAAFLLCFTLNHTFLWKEKKTKKKTIKMSKCYLVYNTLNLNTFGYIDMSWIKLNALQIYPSRAQAHLFWCRFGKMWKIRKWEIRV